MSASASVRCFAPLTAILKPGDGGEQSGRWVLNTGDEMMLDVPALRPSQGDEPDPVRVVVDLATLTTASDRIVALRDHDQKQPLGTWSGFTFGAAGVTADLSLAKPSNENSLPHVHEVTDLLAARVPMQCSIGADPGPAGHWEQIPAGETVTVNGKAFISDAGTPLYVLRKGQMFEATICTFGADDQTGRIAAHRTSTTTKESHMSESQIMAALLAHAGKSKHADARTLQASKLFAAGKKQEDIVSAMDASDDEDDDAEMSKIKAENADLKRKCTEFEAKITDLTSKMAAQVTEHETAIAALRDPSSPEAAAASGRKSGATFQAVEGQTTPPTTLTEGMSQLKASGFAKGDKNQGTALRAEALRRWPTIKRA